MAEETLTPLENYLKVGIHIGTKFKTKYMEPFIYKVRPDGLSVMNVQAIDKRLEIAAKFISQYDSKDIIVACRRENGWKTVRRFAKLIGAKAITGRYPPGILTNPALDNFTEAKLIIVTDPWPDKNIVKDAMRIGIPIIALCDTNNTANNIDFVIPCNNKGRKSLGLAFWILAKEVLKIKKEIKKDEEMQYKIEDFLEE